MSSNCRGCHLGGKVRQAQVKTGTQISRIGGDVQIHHRNFMQIRRTGASVFLFVTTNKNKRRIGQESSAWKQRKQLFKSTTRHSDINVMSDTVQRKCTLVHCGTQTAATVAHTTLPTKIALHVFCGHGSSLRIVSRQLSSSMRKCVELPVVLYIKNLWGYSKRQEWGELLSSPLSPCRPCHPRRWTTN